MSTRIPHPGDSGKVPVSASASAIADLSVIPVVCAWCVKVGSIVQPAGVVSHGICEFHKLEMLSVAVADEWRSGR